MASISKMYFPIVLVVLLLICGCEEQPELAGGTSLVTEVLVFPTHDEPLPTDWGRKYVAGELVQWNGCLHVNAEPTPVTQADSQLPYMLVWPSGFTLIEQSIHNREGVVVASVGDNLRVSMRGVSGKSDLGKRIRQGIPDNCAARSYYIVGDDVSVIGEDEPVFVSIPGSSIKFQRRRTVSTSRRGGTVDTADDYRLPGELVLERDCLFIRHPEDIHPEKSTPSFGRPVFTRMLMKMARSRCVMGAGARWRGRRLVTIQGRRVHSWRYVKVQ